MASSTPTPGMLFVTMEPQDGLSLDQFHEWYNNEHGPTRLRLPAIFTTGQRYRATDGEKPTFLATYDVTDMAILTQPVYTDLRANRSPREAETIGQVAVKRYLFDLQSSRQADDFVPPANQSDSAVDGTVLVYVDVTLNETAETAEKAEAELVRWYEEEHFGMLTKVPGWLRTRRFRTSSLDLPPNGTAPLRIITLHEYKATNGLGGPAHKASMDTPWRTDVFSKYVANKGRRTYSLFYVFGSAPRDLEHLAPLPASKAFVSTDAKTASTPGTDAVLQSYVTTSDGLEIPYRLEGSAAPGAPTVAFSNSLLTSLHMWDDFVAILKQHRPELRILRYDTRGRHAIPSPPVPATVSMLADDLRAVLKHLRIAKLEALIGVSMGGATTFQFALAYPELVGKFIACDFNILSSDANTAAWKERIGVAEGTPTGMETLAGITVARWFHPATVSTKPEATQNMVNMVAANNREGFKYSCQALWNFDMRATAKELRVPGLLVVGDGDGKGALAKAMGAFRETIGKGDVELKIVSQAGHLPMYENPQAFWEAVEHFL
ncbi:hypothetical protein HMPREF1624_08001 [Sporothrix schenckii ATCC 58251]|uniref:AB hydrolase-1 domain-containing protein n=1 Tax=Sporothrix schenckii (strain ATCC 58251 / de Perez 2211183) TaxID=1391915 RepID=U7PLV5_SPOS1|nr:hypothetical protein HMPREF1624_08001 [Sporothrix schenckii ATCC 58251]